MRMYITCHRCQHFYEVFMKANVNLSKTEPTVYELGTIKCPTCGVTSLFEITFKYAHPIDGG